jgi:hypothetical protein
MGRRVDWERSRGRRWGRWLCASPSRHWRGGPVGSGRGGYGRAVLICDMPEDRGMAEGGRDVRRCSPG